jgi:uncharacterized protein YprB with RNaseH-like and TPR domain
MKLASRIARLRANRLPCASAAAIGRPVETHETSSAVGTDHLAKALRGEMIGDGVVVSETRHAVEMTRADRAGLSRLPETQAGPASDWVYIDTETTGLSGGVGTLAFMVGVARYLPDAGLMVRQYTLSRFSGEALMLRDLASWVGEDATLCSYNGRCFDLPLLINRFRLQRQRCGLSSLAHLDLMYGVRRAYRHKWPDCRLQTAEVRRLGVRRMGDMPGALAPAAWQRWLASDDPSMLVDVLAHNRQDVVSLANLHLALVNDHADAAHPDLDPGAIALAWYKQGCVDEAMRIWATQAARLTAAASLQRAMAYRRAGRWKDAESIWLRLYEQGNSDAALALSKYYEHRCRDYPRAMHFARGCGDPDDVRQKRLHQKLVALQSVGRSRMINLELPLLPRPVNGRHGPNRRRQIV